MNNPATTVHPIDFKAFSGEQFERLVFAYHVRTGKWKSIEWYGQVGSDLGRDIIAVTDVDSGASQLVCIQCVNRATLTQAKATQDIDKAVKASGGKPDLFRIVCRSSASAQLRDKIKKHAKKKGVKQCDVWSGTEFEEFLRNRCESLLKRFVEGVAFPDSSAELLQFANTIEAADDRERLELIARLFDRPAFYTPMQSESNVPAFKQAITDTIQALNTGIWQTRDGKEIGRIPTRHDFSDPNIRDTLQKVEVQLAKVRTTYEELSASNDLRPCGCGQPHCPTLMLSPKAVRDLTDSRSRVLNLFQEIYRVLEKQDHWGGPHND